jgi:DNA-binding MarR family transcriptional regulator
VCLAKEEPRVVLASHASRSRYVQTRDGWRTIAPSITCGPVHLPKYQTTVKRASATSRRRAGANPWLALKHHGANLNVEDFLTFRITRLSNALRTNLTKRYLEEFGLSLPEWRLLALITRFSPLRFSEVTTRSSMDKGQVSRTLRAMTKRGLTKTRVVRRPSSAAADALAAPVIVSITARGRALYQSILPIARRRQAEILLTLPEADRLALYQIVDKLFAAAGSAAVSGEGD